MTKDVNFNPANIFWPVLGAVVIGVEFHAWWIRDSVSAYYADGKRALFHANVAAQSVNQLFFGPDGAPLFSDSETLTPCRVGDVWNWTCAVTINYPDGSRGDALGFIQAVNGQVKVSNRTLIQPISWEEWEWNQDWRWVKSLLGTPEKSGVK